MEKDTESLYQYSYTVHQSLVNPILFFGIGEQAFMLIVMVTVILSSLISIWCIIIGVVALVLMRFICKKEPYIVDFIIESLNNTDIYRG